MEYFERANSVQLGFLRGILDVSQAQETKTKIHL